MVFSFNLYKRQFFVVLIAVFSKKLQHFAVFYTRYEVTPNQISTSHRLPLRHTRYDSNLPKTSPSPPIVVWFVNRDVRNKIYVKRKLTRNLDFSKFSVYGMKL